MTSTPRQKLRIGLFFLLGIIGASYILFQSQNLILGPEIVISEPSDGATLSYNLVTIKGSTKNVTTVTIDDRPIFIDKQGLFSEKLIAPPGYSIIKVTGQDRFGKKIEKRIHLYLPKAAASPLLETPVSTSTEILGAKLSTSTQASSTHIIH